MLARKIYRVKGGSWGTAIREKRLEEKQRGAFRVTRRRENLKV